MKHVVGLLLCAFGALCLLGALGQFIQPDPELPFWMVEAVLLVFGTISLGGAYFFLRAKLVLPTKPCPQCGETESEAAGVLIRNANPWIYHFGGWLMAALWGASREQQVRCIKCETLYFTQTKASRIAGICLWVFILVIAFAGIIEILTEGQGNHNGIGNDF